MKTSIVIYRSLPEVWDYFITTENWLAWWGGELQEVVPAWEEGAIMRWSSGEPTRLVHFLPRQQAGLQGKWMETIYRFQQAPGGSTLLEVELLPLSGASFPDGGKSHLDDIATAIDHLKRLMEGTPLPKREPIFPPEPAPAAQTAAVKPLGGVSYLALMAAMLGIGFVMSLIPCPGVNSLIYGWLGAWLWVRREHTPARLRPRRGLLAGMLTGLGGSLVGSLFFMSGIAGEDFTALLGALTAALLFFLVPAALSGLVTGIVLWRRALREAPVLPVEASAETSDQAATQTAPPLPTPPALDKDSLKSKMQSSAAQARSLLPANAAADATRDLVKRVTSGAEFSFALETAVEKLPECLESYSPLNAAEVFEDCLVAVSLYPAWTPDQVRALLPEGYVKLVQELAAPYQAGEHKLHVAHWVIASDGGLTSVYLTAIPNAEDQPDAPALIARELLSNEERTQLGI
jgi:hypothetical protein